MKFGSLRIQLPDGQIQIFPMEVERISIGRAPDNSLVLDDEYISRWHALLMIENGHLQVQDLGSTNGTYLNGERLQTNKPTTVHSGQIIQIGIVVMRYLPPPQGLPKVPSEGAEESKAAEKVIEPNRRQQLPGTKELIQSDDLLIDITLTGPARPVAPGNRTTASLTIQNKGPSEAELLISVAGVPDDWVLINEERVRATPNSLESVIIYFQPERSRDVSAGDYPIGISVYSPKHRKGTTIGGVLQVTPYQELNMELQPLNEKGNYYVFLENRGNATAECWLSGNDDHHSLNFTFGQDSVTLQPDQKVNIPLRITPKDRPKLRNREERLFQLIAMPLNPGVPPVKIESKILVRPSFTQWILPFSLIE